MSGGKPNFLKVIILGDGAVGKSALMNRFVNNKFDTQSFHTIGVEFLNKEVKVATQNYTLQIWDTAGQERFKSLRTPFYRGSDICLLVYSVDDEQSFENLETWIREFLYYAEVKDDENFPFVVLGNKVDLPKKVIPLEKAQAWAKSKGISKCYETSAKDSINVNQAFVSSVEKWLEQENALDSTHKTSPNYTNKINLKKHEEGYDSKEKSSTCC